MLFPVTPIILDPTFEGWLKFKIVQNYYQVPKIHLGLSSMSPVAS
jgi:hypothetical protein